MGSYSVHDDLAQLRRDIPKRPVMLQDEAVVLLRKYRKTKRVKYRNQVVESYHPLQVMVALEHFNGHMPIKDLVQESTIGFIKGIEGFPIDRRHEKYGVSKLYSYGKTCCNNAVIDFIRNCCRTVRVPKEILLHAERVEKAAIELAQDLEREYFTPDMLVKHKSPKEAARIAHAVVDVQQNISPVRGHELGGEEMDNLYDHGLIRDEIERMPPAERRIMVAFSSMDEQGFSSFLAKARLPSEYGNSVVSDGLDRLRRVLGVAPV